MEHNHQIWELLKNTKGYSSSFNSYPPSAAYMHPLIRSTLVQIMACRLFGTNPFSEPMLCCCQLEPWEQTSVNFNQKNFPFKKMFLQYCLQKVAILSRGRWVNTLMSGDAYLHQCTGSVYMQVMNCHLIGIKPLPKSMLIYNHLDPQVELTLVKFTPKCKNFLPRICT